MDSVMVNEHRERDRAGRLTSRRAFLRACSGGIGLGMLSSCILPWRTARLPFFLTRGVVLRPEDLTLADWPDQAHEAGLTTLALHHDRLPREVARFVRSEEGQEFIRRCSELGLELEYEVPAMDELLPRSLFDKRPSLFRMDRQGLRNPDANLCVHSEGALELVAKHALALARNLRPTTHRYFMWGQCDKPWCRCRRCADLADSDQALLLANWLLTTLRQEDAGAQVAYLAHERTLEPPTQVKPVPGVFLEFAPYRRRHDLPLAHKTDERQKRYRDLLDANLALFGADNAQVLEYWLDVSRFSLYKKPAVKLPFNAQFFAADLDFYGGRGIRRITSFAHYIDADYVATWGDPPLEAYGTGLAQWTPL